MRRRRCALTPVEWLLHGLAGCLMAGVANIAAARGIKLTKVKCSVDGDMDLRGILGISDEVRNGLQNIHVSFEDRRRCAGRKAPAAGRAVARACSAVFDVLTKGVPVTVGIKTIQ
ncbi:OsmC family protein [Mesorhizobium atlanticum]